MPVRTKRWNEPVAADDGFRLLVCRYRPRGVPKAKEPWDGACLALAPSRELLAAYYGKDGETPISFEVYTERFLEEMKSAKFWITSFAERVRAGETLTLLCSSACTDPACCHRTLLKALIENAAQAAVNVPRRR